MSAEQICWLVLVIDITRKNSSLNSYKWLDKLSHATNNILCWTLHCLTVGLLVRFWTTVMQKTNNSVAIYVQVNSSVQLYGVRFQRPSGRQTDRDNLLLCPPILWNMKQTDKNTRINSRAGDNRHRSKPQHFNEALARCTVFRPTTICAEHIKVSITLHLCAWAHMPRSWVSIKMPTQRNRLNLAPM